MKKDKPTDIKCRFCGYDGTWTEKDRPRRNPVEIDRCGVASILCSKCGRRTVLK